MSLRDDDDDTSAGRMTQGGSPDAGSPGPGRRSGNSFLWFALVLIVVVVMALAWMSTLSRKDAPAERGTAPISGSIGLAGRSGGPAATPAAPATP